MSFIDELKRRNVIRVGVAYAVAAWFLLQISDLVLGNIAAPGWVIQVIMLLLAIGFPLILIFAWAFEMTPEGLKREREVDRTQSITPQTGRKLDRMIIGIMAIVIAFLVLDRFVLREGSGSFSQESTVLEKHVDNEQMNLTPGADTGPSVAVLPFVNMSGDINNEYFSDGLTETLLHMLAQLPDLRVAARTSSFAFKGKDTGIAEISAILGVAHVLEGSVQKAGNRVRVTAQLIRADDGFHVWSQNYDRTLDDIFAIQDEIATDVASALGTSLMGASTPGLHGVSTRNTKAYDLFLQALEQQSIFSYSSLGAAEGLLKNALAIDPEFTEAKMALARNYGMKLDTGLIEYEEASSAALPLLHQVKEQNPGEPLARALELTFLTHFEYTRLPAEQRHQAMAEMRALLPYMPGDTWVRTKVAQNLTYGQGRPEEALEVLQAGLLSDPLSADLHWILARVYRNMDRYDEALASLDRAMELEPENPNFLSQVADVHTALGDLVEALTWYRRATVADPGDHELVAALAFWFFQLDMAEEGERWASRCFAMAPQTPVCRRIQLQQAQAHGDDELSLQLARQMLEEDIGTRRFGFAAALFSYSDMMQNQGRAREAYDFLAERYPFLLTPEIPPRDLKDSLVRRAGIELMLGFAPREQAIEAMEFWVKHWEAATQDTYDEWDQRMWMHLVRGENSLAAEIALADDLSRPLSNNIRWKTRYTDDPMRRVLADIPEVAVRLRELDREMAILRSEVQQMLMSPEWQQ